MIIGIMVVDELKRSTPADLVRDAAQAYEKRFGTKPTHANVSDQVDAPVIEGLLIQQVKYIRPNAAIAGVPA